MKIEVLGTGCVRCNTTEAIVKEAVLLSGIDAHVVKVSDRIEIAKAGVLMTPAVIVNGQVKAIGNVPEIEDVLRWINESQS